MKHLKDVYKTRRDQLLSLIEDSFPSVKGGAVLLLADFESERLVFRQESSFYYLTGIEEPAVAILFDLNGKSTLYVPRFTDSRSQWVSTHATADTQGAQSCGVDEVVYLGEPSKGYSFSLLSPLQQYSALSEALRHIIAQSGAIFTLSAPSPRAYVSQKIVLARLTGAVPGMDAALRDISPLVAAMRRKKSKIEIEMLYKATEITLVAQQAAACAIQDGVYEYEVQAGIEYVFKEANAMPSFPTIVGSGPNSVVLHYTANSRQMKQGDLVVVDIGAERDYYCADITRTYPVSGSFTQRQREIYQIVLDTQEYIASVAQPGYWLNNKDKPEKSLHHLAQEFLSQQGYAKYFPHGIGHFLGIDVHDVGDYSIPLSEGDVITIEPGIYLPQEGLGVRIEDDYWIVPDGAMCLSEDLPKTVDAIEQMACADFSKFDEHSEE